jgi:alpha/beta superfamily hydrolase
VVADTNTAEEARALAVLLHPHPDFGGNRYHPFIDALFHRLPDIAVTAIRFDFSSAEPSTAQAQVVAAIDEGSTRGAQLPVVLAGYSFGAGIAAAIDDERIAAWYLLAPQAAMLSAAPIGHDPRAKGIAVPEFDQFSPPAAIEQVVSGWESTTVTTVPNADHFLGAVSPIVEDALSWIDASLTSPLSPSLGPQDEGGRGSGRAPAG